MRQQEVRLFAAICFSEQDKVHFCAAVRELQMHAMQSSCTLHKNLHLTLLFLGGVPPERVADARRAVRSVPFAPTSIPFTVCGSFSALGPEGSRSREKLVWFGTEKSPALHAAHDALLRAMTAAGLPADRKPFLPHVTLARRFISQGGMDEQEILESFLPFEAGADKICLMRSDRIRGQLVYTDISD